MYIILVGKINKKQTRKASVQSIEWQGLRIECIS